MNFLCAAVELAEVGLDEPNFAEVGLDCINYDLLRVGMSVLIDYWGFLAL